MFIMWGLAKPACDGEIKLRLIPAPNKIKINPGTDRTNLAPGNVALPSRGVSMHCLTSQRVNFGRCLANRGGRDATTGF